MAKDRAGLGLRREGWRLLTEQAFLGQMLSPVHRHRVRRVLPEPLRPPGRRTEECHSQSNKQPKVTAIELQLLRFSLWSH